MSPGTRGCRTCRSSRPRQWVLNGQRAKYTSLARSTPQGRLPVKRTTLLLLAVVGACKSNRPPAANAATQPSRTDGTTRGGGGGGMIVVPAGKEWTQPGGDYATTRYSSLSQISTGNVAQLKVATT